METKIPMKTIYLILVITIGLVGLGVGSTFAVFTASAEITNPISFSSNLTYNGDIFDTTEVTIGPNSYTFSNISIYNEEQLEGIKYTTWYIYDGSASDLTFEETQDGDTTPSGNDISGGGTVGLKITNNTSNTITITIGVTTSRDDIVLPSYMKPITFSTATKYTLTITKGTGVDSIYYKTGSDTSYTRSSSNVSISLEKGTAYSYYGIGQIGYTLSSCNGLDNVCTGTMGTSAVTKSLTATTDYNNLIINKGTGVSAIYYKVNGASSYTSSNFRITISVQTGTTYYYYGTPSTGYTMSSCTASSPCSGTMGTSTVTKNLTATVNSYNLTLNKGTGVSTIYYKVNGASNYSSSTTNTTISVQYGTTYYYYGMASTGYTMNSCTVANPCSGTMGTSAVTKSLSATTSSGPFTVTLYVDDDLVETKSVSGGGKFERSFSAPTSTISCSCTNGQTCSISHSSGVYYMATIESVTANTTCKVTY